ncbi:MAG: trypsin-like serine protease [Polyangiaceae bacterium]
MGTLGWSSGLRVVGIALVVAAVLAASHEGAQPDEASDLLCEVCPCGATGGGGSWEEQANPSLVLDVSTSVLWAEGVGFSTFQAICDARVDLLRGVKARFEAIHANPPILVGEGQDGSDVSGIVCQTNVWTPLAEKLADAATPALIVSDGINHPVGQGDDCDGHRNALVAATAALLKRGPEGDVTFAVLDSVSYGDCPRPSICAKLPIELRSRCHWLPVPGLTPSIAVIDPMLRQLARSWRRSGSGAGREELLDSLGHFPDALVVGSDDAWQCTGVMISDQVALTARHCLPATRVLLDAEDIRHGTLVAVDRVAAHPELDVAALRLARPMATRAKLRRRAGDRQPPSGVLRAVGFGPTPDLVHGEFGRRKLLDIPAEGWGCEGQRVVETGCRPERELVVVGNVGRDTCRGDSGGALYELYGDGEVCGWRLVGVTSRGVPHGATACGAGGIYTRVDAVDAWLTETIERFEKGKS